MSLPGLDLTQPTAERQYAPAPPSQIYLSKSSEWRFEVAFGTTVRVKLIDGTAELFGTELAPSQTYTFSGTKAAIYTWHGCTLEISEGDKIPALDAVTSAGANGASTGFGAGGCQSEYTAEETPMVEYANVHFALETLRRESKATGKDGPRVLILGPENAGKTSLAKLLTAYATKTGRQPIVVNLDPGEGLLSVAGTLSAAAFRTMLDVEEGWGNSPMSGPSPVPVKLPLVYFYPEPNPLEVDGGAIYRPIVSKLALSVSGRMAEDEDSRETGIIVDTPGVLSQGKPGSEEMINHIITEFSITTILVIGSERMYSAMMRTYDNKPTTSASAAASDERISVIKLSKSGGCVDRDPVFMKAIREAQIRSYFFGNPIPSSTASSGLAIAASSASNITLSPHAQQLDFNSLSIYTIPGSGSDETEPEEDDDYDPAQLSTGPSFLPGSGSGSSSDPKPEPHPSTTPYKKIPAPAPASLANSLLAISHAPPNASPAEIRDSSIMGFLYVADVDVEKGKIRVLSPVGGRVPARALIWGSKWPEEVVGLVG